MHSCEPCMACASPGVRLGAGKKKNRKDEGIARRASAEAMSNAGLVCGQCNNR